MKVSKKILAVLLAVMMLMSTMAFSASAGIARGDDEYTVNLKVGET